MSYVEDGTEDSDTQLGVIVIQVKLWEKIADSCKECCWNRRYRMWLLTGCTWRKRGRRKVRGISQSWFRLQDSESKRMELIQGTRRLHKICSVVIVGVMCSVCVLSYALWRRWRRRVRLNRQTETRSNMVIKVLSCNSSHSVNTFDLNFEFRSIGQCA